MLIYVMMSVLIHVRVHVHVCAPGEMSQLQEVLSRLHYDKNQELSYEQISEGLQYLGGYVSWKVAWAGVRGCASWVGEGGGVAGGTACMMLPTWC